MDFSMYLINCVIDFLKCFMGDKEFLCRINIFKYADILGKNNT